MQSIDLSIASRLELVYLLGLAVRGVCQGLPLSRDEADALELATCEAANNSIKHAYKGRPDGMVRVTLVVDGTGLVICVQDQGEPLKDRTKLTNDLAVAQSLEDLPEGGMGLYLIRTAADSVGYKAGNPNNVLVIRKAFGKASE
ncbi:serine/threonine-protein kinase RsbW [Humidesulfovibrio mexicanus]|uniref:Serine/threonine-protein kinase RsbW n=1 Tax=Humidesulfovibrio mexicanus TaxID=147047 RepID=A0A239D3G9_9BACT|nr:ATP-binding protein [Humidesulfovibrio mexicanus]SNS26769.1 serine/threonine-protein kinase RsbW [Humidesulfovibrio mexicanus]